MKFRNQIYQETIIKPMLVMFIINYNDNEIMDNMEIIDVLNDAILICESINIIQEYRQMLIWLVAKIKEYRENNKDDNIVYVKLIHDGEIQKTIL